MADSILRLRVSSEEYDNKIKRAQQGLLHMEEACRKVGGTLAVLEKDEKDFVQALGSMETVSKTARGRLNELTTAFTEFSMLYKRLSDEEKQGDIGQALIGSLEQLKARIAETKSQLADTNRELNGTPGILEQFTSRLTVNIDAVKLFNVGLQAAGAALNVAKDAFFASEQNLDDWNRAVYASKSVYEGFLTSLNTGDIGGFLSNIESIVDAANSAYNAIDRLQTTQNIQTPRMQSKQAEVQRMETMLRTGRYIAPVDGRRGTMEEGTLLNADQKKKIADNLASAMSEIAAMTRTEVQRSTDAINALYQEQAIRLGMSNEQFRKGTATIAEFEANLDKAGKYREWEAKHTTYTIDTQTGGTNTIRTGGANPYEAYKGWGVFKDDGELYQTLLSMIRSRTSSESQYYGQVGRAYRGINRGEGISMREGSAGRKSAGTTKSEQTELQKNQKAISDLTEEYQRLADVSKTATGQTLSAATERMTAIKTEIKALQDRNDELKRWADEAAGKTTGLIEEQTKKAARLNEELTHATTVADIQRINKELEATNDRLIVLRGKLPENKTAEFKVEVDAKQLAELQDKLPKGATITERVNVEQGEVNLPSVPTDDKTIKVNVEQGEVDMPDVPTDDKTIRVNVEQGEVNLPNVPTDDKTIKVNVEQGEVNLPSVPTDDKTIKVNVEQGEVDMPDVPTDDKTIKVNVEQGEVNLSSVPTDDKTIRVNVEQGEVDMPDVPTDVKQLVRVTADTAEAAQAIAELVDGNYTVTIAAKMNMEEGFAGLSDNSLSAYIAGLKKDLSGEEIGSDFYNKIAQNMGDATALQNVIKTAVAAGLDLSGFDFEMPWEQILSFDDADDALTSLIEQINEKLKEIGMDPIKINLQTGADEAKSVTKNAKETQKAWSAAASAINSASSAMQNMEDPAAKVAGIVMQAIANIALGFSKQSIEAAGGGPLAWIAATLSGLAVMTSTIAAIKSATKGGFAEGGIVPGNSYSGDLLRTSDYGINSGELILNRAQQNNIASQLETGYVQQSIGTPYVTGEMIYLGVRNYLRRSGRGEIITSK